MSDKYKKRKAVKCADVAQLLKENYDLLQAVRARQDIVKLKCDALEFLRHSLHSLEPSFYEVAARVPVAYPPGKASKGDSGVRYYLNSHAPCAASRGKIKDPFGDAGLFGIPRRLKAVTMPAPLSEDAARIAHISSSYDVSDRSQLRSVVTEEVLAEFSRNQLVPQNEPRHFSKPVRAEIKEQLLRFLHTDPEAIELTKQLWTDPYSMREAIRCVFAQHVILRLSQFSPNRLNSLLTVQQVPDDTLMAEYLKDLRATRAALCHDPHTYRHHPHVHRLKCFQFKMWKASMEQLTEEATPCRCALFRSVIEVLLSTSFKEGLLRREIMQVLFAS